MKDDLQCPRKTKLVNHSYILPQAKSSSVESLSESNLSFEDLDIGNDDFTGAESKVVAKIVEAPSKVIR